MPRFASTPPDGKSRQAIEQRARAAASPAAAEDKGRWPFPMTPTPATDADPAPSQPALPPHLNER